MSDDLAYMPATELIKNYRAGRLSPVEAVRASLNRIERDGKKLNAFTIVDTDAALAAASESEQRWKTANPKGLLDGVPTTIKDLVVTEGWPTLRGSRAIDPDQAWNEDAPCVARLREHGAVLLGKTTTPEFGHKGVTDSILTGITRNPWNLDKTPGGSSGGASAAVAAGMGQLAIGTDAGGSIRIPACFAGVYGLKPTFGRVPTYPPSPFGTLSHAGPMTRTVADAALMLTVIAQPDARDWYGLPYDNEDYSNSVDGKITGLKIAFSPDLGLDTQVDTEVAEAVFNAARQFSNLGASVETIDIDWPVAPRDILLIHFTSSVAKMMSMLTEEQRAKIEPTLAAMATEGEKLDMLSLKTAELDRVANGIYMNHLLTQYDLLLCPTLPVLAFDVGQPCPNDYVDDPFGWIPFTPPFNLTGQPAASIPCGFSDSGLPIGLQIVGPMYGDATVLTASRAFERARPFADKRPKL
ncbi:MAG TPA: amidase [Alphaproteobacteria bacterium]|nr:amidase [Alphaproteobacteria bacterium]